MNFGYDEYGNRQDDDSEVDSNHVVDNNNNSSSSSSEGDDKSSSSDSVDGRDSDSNSDEEHMQQRRRSAHANGDAHDDDDEDDDDNAADEHDAASQASDFSDDVELVVGEVATQPHDQPLVTADELHAHARAPAALHESSDVHLIDAGPQQQPLLQLTDDRAAAATTAVVASLPRAAAFAQVIARAATRVHCVALVGALHHGKTSLLQLMLRHGSYRARADERERGMTLKSHVVTAVCSGPVLQPMSRVVCFVDTPGHGELFAEAAAALRMADVALLCVDVVEGVGDVGERLLRHMVLREQLPIVLVLTKLDRLITELKLPPLDAYRKLRSIIDAVNNAVVACGAASAARALVVSPENGSVCFASSTLGLFFSLETFALKYAALYNAGGRRHRAAKRQPRARRDGEDDTQEDDEADDEADVTCDYAALAQRLWGPVALERGRAVRLTRPQQRPSFVEYVLEPLYKIVAHAVTGQAHTTLTRALPPLPSSPLAALRAAVRQLCGDAADEAADALLSVLPSCTHRLSWLLTRYGCDSSDGKADAHDSDKDTSDGGSGSGSGSVDKTREEGGDSTADDDVVALVTLVRTVRNDEVAAVARVLRGTLRSSRRGGGSSSTSADKDDTGAEEDDAWVVVDAAHDALDEAAAFATLPARGAVRELYLPLASRSGGGGAAVRVAEAYAGQVVLVTGELAARREGHHMLLLGGRAATAARLRHDKAARGHGAHAVAAAPSLYGLACAAPLVHVGVELKEPAKAAQLQDSLHTLRVTTPGLDVHREETGEYTLTGYGELHLDAALHELRVGRCRGVALALSPPYVTFRETVLDAEGVLAVAGVRHGSIACVTGTLPPQMTPYMEYGHVPVDSVTAATSSHHGATLPLWSTLRRDGGLDALDAQHVLAFGPHATRGPSVLLDDTLDEELAASSAAVAEHDDDDDDDDDDENDDSDKGDDGRSHRRRSGTRKGGTAAVAPWVRELAATGVTGAAASRRALSTAQRGALVAAFRATVAAGPLTGDVVHGVGVKLVFADVARDTRAAAVLSSGRAAMRQALLGARPRLLEPVLSVDVVCTPECVTTLREVLQQRRGAVVAEDAIVATPLLRVRALVPAMDSFGLETQLRMSTHGQAYPSFRFAQWDVVPGDPWDARIVVPPLEPARGFQLARDFVLKTRFRKGLPLNLMSEL